MKKLFLTCSFLAFFISFILLLLPWNVNFAKSDCDGILHKTLCKNSLTIIQTHIAGNTAPEIIPCMIPFDDPIIKI